MAAEAEGIKAAVAIVRGIRDAAGPLAQPSRSSPARKTEEAGEPGLEFGSPTVFITWAHAHSSWSKEKVSDWQEQVATFSGRLVHFGVDAEVDLWHLDEPTDWTRFGPRGIQDANRTVIVMSEAWAERWSGSNAPTEGAGAAAEADVLRGLFSRNQAAWQQRLLIVIFPDVKDATIPPELHRISRVYLDPTLPDDYEVLLRNLSGQPRYIKPKLGKVPTFRTDSQAGDGALDLQARLARVQSENDERLRKFEEGQDSDKGIQGLRRSLLRGLKDAAQDDE